MRTRREIPEGFDARCTVFAVGWAIAALFDKLWWKHWSGAPTNWVLVAAAVFLLVRPRSALALGALALAQLSDWFVDTAPLGVHSVVMAFSNASILAALAVLYFPGRPQDADGPDALREAAPALRMIAILTYAIATLHKLNTDFLDPATSCVAMLMRTPMNQPLPLRLLPNIPDAAVLAGIHGTLVTEAAIAVLLWLRRGRGAGIVLALLFHSFLSSGPRNGFSAFAIVMFPLLVLFATEGAASRLLAAVAGLRRRLSSGPLGRTGPVAAAAALAAIAAVSDRIGMYRMFPPWISYDLFLLAFAANEIRRHRGNLGDSAEGFFDVARPALAIVPVLFLMNGLSPYLGLKTEGALAMFSNLRTEGRAPNSLVVSSGMKFFGFQDDLVEVKACSAAELQPFVGKNLRLPFFQLRRVLTSRPEASVTYERAGRLVRIDRVDRHPDVLPPVPTWQRRLLDFRAVDAEGGQACRH